MPDPFRLFGPVLRCLEPETAHNLTLRAFEWGLAGGGSAHGDPILATRCWARDVPNPIGLAAGFDKDARVFEAMLDLGFGFVETGTVTPQPQPGNPKPRVFRLTEDAAVINRLGFNNRGLENAARRLANRRGPGVVGANIGRNKDSAVAVADYVDGLKVMAPLADYVVVNISSPNTPGLRDLHAVDNLHPLLEALIAARRSLPAPASACPICLKIAPDLADDDAIDVARLALDLGLDGLTISNTTVVRPAGLKSGYRDETGGLSGRPLFSRSTELLGHVYRETSGRLLLTGVGGVVNADDAYTKIRAGATLVQLYTGLVYGGPRLVRDIGRGLAERLRRDGFASAADAVGADHA